MPSKTLLQAGIVTLLVGIVLFLSIPIGLTYVEMYPVSYRTVAPVLFWSCVSLADAGGLLVFRAAFGLLPVTWQWNPNLHIFPAMPLRNGTNTSCIAQQTETAQPTVVVRSALVMVPALATAKGGDVVFG